MITSSNEKDEPVAIVFGVPFDSTHSYKPGTRFGPDAIRNSFNNIEIFHPQFQVDLETVNIEDLGNTNQESSFSNPSEVQNLLCNKPMR